MTTQKQQDKLTKLINETKFDIEQTSIFADIMSVWGHLEEDHLAYISIIWNPGTYFRSLVSGKYESDGWTDTVLEYPEKALYYHEVIKWETFWINVMYNLYLSEKYDKNIKQELISINQENIEVNYVDLMMRLSGMIGEVFKDKELMEKVERINAYFGALKIPDAPDPPVFQ